MPLGPNEAYPGVINYKYFKKSSCLKLQGIEHYYLVFKIIKWSSTKIVKIMPTALYGQKGPREAACLFNIRVI